MSIKESKEYKALKRKLDKANDKVKSIVEEMRLFRGTKKILCGGCKTESQISDIPFVQFMVHHKSYAAYEDDTWDMDERYARFICPHCQTLLQSDYKDNELLSLRSDFGAIITRYPAEWEFHQVTWKMGGKLYTTQADVFAAFTKLLEMRKK